ncbi:alpha/beta hydrolase fold domain-containing protein [Nonomuraea sp. NN258]|nr:alpha/beta hydrolase fold domain-containing protein [Nonomuraea antri]
MASDVGPVVWVDLRRADGVRVGGAAAHLHGRGIEGLAWGIRHAVHRARHPRLRIPYGPDPDQWGELHLPDSPTGRVPVVALIHGGYWRSIWAADLMDALCADLAGRGFAGWNLEYRRPDRHGWAATCADVAAGLHALTDVATGLHASAGVDAPLDLDRVAVAGHSAGGQLALRAAADGARVSLAVSLAGVLDLVEGDRRWLSSGAVAAALGHPAPPVADHAEDSVGAARVYGTASPLLRLPLKVRQLIVQGSDDDLDLLDFGRRYARSAEQAGDDVTYLELPGDHFAVITPDTPIWRATAQAIEEALR